MPSRRLTPRMAWDVALSAVCTRNMLTRDRAPVIAELRALAGEGVALLAQVAGRYESPETMPLCAALVAEIEGAGSWAQASRKRRSRGAHGAPSREADRPPQTSGGV